MKLLSLFSGIGAFEKALDRLKASYELVGFSEIDKYAIKSYCAIHNVLESLNLGDITKIDEKSLPQGIDLITYGFPCQDISLAGKQKGLFNEDGTQTRSGLFFDALRVIEATQPRVAIAENVKNLTSKKFKEQFEIVLDSLEEAGYNNYWQVLNAKDYGIPQNRERVFIISIRKDIDTGLFKFLEGFPLELRLKDMLELTVEDKYFLSSKGIEYITNQERLEKKYTSIDGEVSLCLTAKGNSNWTGTFVSEPLNAEKDGTCRTIKAQYYKSGPANYKRTGDMGATGVAIKVREATMQNLRIRKLTPKECFRLQGFDDSDFEKAEATNSNTQLYKQAGNSICVPVLEHIISALFDCGALERKDD